MAEASTDFPSYAQLSQTAEWSQATERVELAEATSITGPRYTEGAVLGVGGMGKVVLARDSRIGRDVAVKVLKDQRELSADEHARFLREAQVQGQLEHPSIVPVYDIDEGPDGSTFFTMRRVLGRTLHAILEDLRHGLPAAKARYTQRELLTAFATVCLTIDYAHSRGVIHRDLKPANIMLGDFGEVYVLDWGLARVEEMKLDTVGAPRLTSPGAMMGTPMYMAPEQMVNPEVGPDADVFSLGCILFEILTLQIARDPSALFAPIDARPSVRTPALGIAPELETICVKATAFDASERYQSARALQEALVRYLEGDRELEQRRVLAGEYAKAAAAALARAEQPGADYDKERTGAMRMLRHALALDPDNIDHVAMLAKIVTTPPREVPPEVTAQLAAQEQQLVRTGARHAVVANAIWFLFLPLVIFMGVREPLHVVLVLGPAGVSAILAIIAARQKHIGYPITLGVIGVALVGASFVSTMYGPLVLMPTLVAVFTIVIQAHPKLFIRRATYVMASIALIVTSLVELLRPASYQAIDGMLAILPRMHDIPRTESIVLMMLASLAMLIVPSLFIGMIRNALSDAQTKILVQAWQFRRMGEDLIQRSRP